MFRVASSGVFRIVRVRILVGRLILVLCRGRIVFLLIGRGLGWFCLLSTAFSFPTFGRGWVLLVLRLFFFVLFVVVWMSCRPIFRACLLLGILGRILGILF